MASITRFSIVTLVFFILSIVFVIYPVKIKIRRKRIPHIPINLTTAPILAIAILWGFPMSRTHADGIVGTEGVKPYNILILFFSLAYMAITLDISGVLQAAAFWVSNKGGTNGRRLYFYFYILLTVVSVLIGKRSREMKPIEKLDVRQAIRDPVSACVGSALLFGCVVVIMVVSFFKVDVWKVSLPFAGAKFIFDLVWDYVRPKPPAEEPKLEGDTPVEDDITFNMQRAMTMQSTIGRQPTAEVCCSDCNVDLRPFTPRYPLQFPTFFTALPRLPFALVPFAFSQFILIEALAHQGWIDVFAHWLVRASHGRIYPAVWLVGVLGVILCNIAGTNIGATILLTKIVRAAALPPDTTRAAGVALAVASNIGAVSFTFSASLAGLLWKTILKQKQEEIAEDEAEKLAHAKRTKKDLEPGSFQFSKRLEITQGVFAWWNLLPLSVMTAVGLAVVSAEMAVLY
ncbi:Arsenical pump membrane protein [Mycena venus]|uniref:Arsenical pump membrane protein n=1 Tax=Mycena venus TaxID=2733690 RepID=A0A8H6XKF3_9AGAR|nr:Arsenical pump membrane protein [Mycena venus]